MIEGLFETHLFVKDLERSIDFYKNILKLEPCDLIDERPLAFFWIGKGKKAMLGLWEKPKDQIDIRHFAFQCSTEFILNESENYLHSHGIKTHNFLKDETHGPMVFAWMPALSIYFEDPDGHSLEFISMLPQQPQKELAVVSYDEWIEKSKSR